ncbi:hypothetical protein QBC34DRAFT_415957 [Podospora aff. communis PSN243]|uniref:Uncharacterized protein n=1 Tax=Podospora aff. communis PSN243 TaxID=3040156 RepID=A0AAV9G992_9PEZI|nr:hypothetical protein QBC34DRAFT_415957 [Podospora aff. communis PSN243]
MTILRPSPLGPVNQDQPEYTVSIIMVPLPSDPDSIKLRAWHLSPWGAVIDLQGITQADMRQGLAWNTNNIIYSASYYIPWRKVMYPLDEATQTIPWSQDFTRRWLLREFADRPCCESRWGGSVSLLAHSGETLSGFDLSELRRELIRSVVVKDEADEVVFEFDADDESRNVNSLPWLGESGDVFGLRWAWPMESIVVMPPLGTRLTRRWETSWRDVVEWLAWSDSWTFKLARVWLWLLFCFVIATCVLGLAVVGLVFGAIWRGDFYLFIH